MLLHEQLKDYNLLLASGSPRRKELLTTSDLQFKHVSLGDVEELYPDDLDPYKVPCFLSELKSQAYKKTLSKKDILITADTVVILDNQIIGKPKDAQNAAKILGRLSGNVHDVVTGVTLRNESKTVTFDVLSHVFFRKLTNEEIQYYIAKYQPMDKAGAYGIQEWMGCVAIERVEGSFYNVMGLPMARLYEELKLFVI